MRRGRREDTGKKNIEKRISHKEGEQRKVVEASVEHKVEQGAEQHSMVLTNCCGGSFANLGHG